MDPSRLGGTPSMGFPSDTFMIWPAGSSGSFSFPPEPARTFTAGPIPAFTGSVSRNIAWDGSSGFSMPFGGGSGIFPGTSGGFGIVRVNPWAVASSLDLLLQGIILAQCHYYFVRHFGTDGWPTRFLVLGIFCLSCIKSSFGFAIVYSTSDPFDGRQATETWNWVKIISMWLATLTGLVVQGWYLRRIAVTRRSWTVMTILMALMLGNIASSVLTVQSGTSKVQSSTRICVLVQSCLVLATNVLIVAILISQALRKNSRSSTNLSEHGVDTTYRFGSTLMLMSIPFTSMSVIELGMVAISFHSSMAQWEEHIIASYCLAKIYVICLMRVLNCRVEYPIPKQIQLRVVTNTHRVSSERSTPIDTPEEKGRTSQDTVVVV